MFKNYQQLVTDSKSCIKEVSVDQLYQQLEDSKALIIDIREANECADGIIPHAICLPRGILEASLLNIPEIKDHADPQRELSERNIYLYCRSGARSALAAESLQKMGLSNVYSVAGGTIAWQEHGFPFNKVGEQ